MICFRPLLVIVLVDLFTLLGGGESALAQPIDQAGWTERKREVTLPNGIRLAYVELGDPDGAPLLLLHG